jgi:Uma2 family endonuclease
MASRFEEHSYSLKQYLDLEKQSREKHEYFQGRVYQMAGGSPNHSLIASNLSHLLGNALEERPCRVYNSDLQIFVKSKDLVTYPDVSVVCGDLAYAEEDRNLVTNPLVIAEVLSPSTASYDQTTKFNLYKGLDSLEDYLLMDSRSMSVVYFHKLGPNQWVQQIFAQPQDNFTLQSLNVELSLARIYTKVEFDQDSQLLR